jgi:predicted Zn-dependent protease with MMP-like domain
MMDDTEFSQLVAEGLDAVPEEYGKAMQNVAVVIADEPTPEQRQKLRLHSRTLLFGLYEGIPRTKRSNYTLVAPDKITIFKNPIILACGNDKQLIKKMVADTVWHEIGHHFGIGEADIRSRQAKRS